MIHFQIPIEYAQKFSDALNKELKDIDNLKNGFIDIGINAYPHGDGNANPQTISWHFKKMPDDTWSSCYDDSESG